MTDKDKEFWPSFIPHPEDEARCYICGQTLGNHGTDETHCPPAVLRPTAPPKSAVAKDHDKQIERLRQLGRDVREGAVELETILARGTTAGGIALMNAGAEILDIADDLADVVRAYPHPGVADQAFAAVTEHIVKLLYPYGSRDEASTGALTEQDIQTLLLYSIAAKAQNAGVQSMIGSALTAFAGSALAAGIGEAGRKAARDTLLRETGAATPRKKKH